MRKSKYKRQYKIVKLQHKPRNAMAKNGSDTLFTKKKKLDCFRIKYVSTKLKCKIYNSNKYNNDNLFISIH